ncbi:TspO/MBR family protein [Dictyocaulus viviparus]|uniref:TspO/MBR family protein n=1 Tax=Dictyocaulus viviparus TaxID=29172 RepID=A0A0D8XK15_DICVI|nr:TspO/MBR family protein [Dictyocaulus viviparus]
MLFWTTQDSRNALVSTMIPGGAAVVAFAVFARDKEVVEWWSTKVKKPNWAPRDVRLYSMMDIITLSPLGYASYLVYKNGGGFDYNDTRLAIGIYGVNMVLALTTIPIIKIKNLGCLWKNTFLIHLTAAGAAYTFYKIDKEAGLWLVPYAIWTGFYAFLTYSINKENNVIKDI